MLNYTIQFYVRNSRIQENKAPIYLRLTLQHQKMEVSTGQFINPTCWNKQKQVAVKCEEAPLINSVLDAIKSNILQAITNLQLSKAEVSLDNVRKLLKGEHVQEVHNLIKVTTEHNQNFERQVGVRYSYGSYKNYKTTLAFLKEFIQKQYGKHDIPLKEVNQKFCENYFIWLTTEKTCRQNGAAKHIQRLKKIINYSIRMGYINNSPVQSYSVALKSVSKVALTWDEIKLIQDLPLQTEVLKNIRNIFIFQVYTGLAYSDIKAFSKKHLAKEADNRIWIRMERTKTHNTFTVPLLPVALGILKQYIVLRKDINTPIFPVLSNQKMNQHLKVIQELAGINKNLHTHLPRHTFATTITLLQGVPIETVSKMLGHSKLAMTQTYAKVGELKIAGDMKTLEEKLNNKSE